MKQQDANKLMAFFLAFVMLGSVFFYFVFQNIPDQQPEEQTQQDFYDPDLWTFDQPFGSISDALNITPPGAVTADFVDLEDMTPQMVEWAKSVKPILSEVDTIYKSNTTKMFFSEMRYGNNRSFLLLSTMDPPKNDFQYIFADSYNSHPLLIRQEEGLQGYFNVMGTPVVLGPQQIVIEVLALTVSLNETVTSYDNYKGILTKVPDAPFQTLTSNVTFAKQFYMGIRLNNGSYERTTAYLDANSTVLKKLNQLKTNSTQREIFSQYDIKTSGNYTIVQISAKDIAPVLMEEAS